MFVRLISRFVATVLALLGFTACDRSPAPAPVAPPSAALSPAATNPASSAPTSASAPSTIHWLGQNRLAADTNAAAVMALWRLPESSTLAAQTLDKLASAPGRLLRGAAATNGASATLLRPLLDDLVSAESLWTFLHPTNGPAAWSVAIRLPTERVSFWQTNLAMALESLTGAKAQLAATGFTLRASSSTVINFVPRHSNDWTLIVFGNSAPGTPHSELEALSIRHAHDTNWLSLDLDLAALNRAFGFGWSLPANSPRVKLHTTGDGVSVLTRGQFAFATAPALTIEPWNIPTNLIHDPLTSFAACRAARPLLASLPFWPKLGLGQPPTQFYTWSQAGLPFQTYFAAPLADASNRLVALAGRLVVQNAWLATNGLGCFTNSADGRLLWEDIIIMEPWLSAPSAAAGGWLAGGFFPATRTNRPAPAELLAQFQHSPTIVYYDWEITEERVQDWMYIAQLLRLALHQAQVPPPSAAIKWLTAISPNLGNCGTIIYYQPPSEWTVNRRSSMGLSAAELHLLADWLESPRFPGGLYSYLAPPDDSTRRNLQKMAVPNSTTTTNASVTNAPAPPR